MWLSQIKKCITAYRPDDLILCNTVNGTEGLNKDLKYNVLDGYKNYSLRELLSVLIEPFFPKHYQKHTELNIQCEGFKKNEAGIPTYL